MDRPTLRTTLEHLFSSKDWALALWECGSASFGRADQWSDLDLLLCVEDGQTLKAVTLLEATLEDQLGIRLKWQVPTPTWHGCWQSFYRFKLGDPMFMLDICISERSKPWTLTERERHGEPQVLFDRIGVARATEIDRAALSKTLHTRVEQLSLTLEMFSDFVEKELLRGRTIDAMHWYQQMILGRLIALLRAKHCPERHDYGWRYLEFDLPKEVAQKIKALAYVKDAADLKLKASQALALGLETACELRRSLLSPSPE